MSDIGAAPNAAGLMDRMYRFQRHIYDATRKFYLLGRDDPFGLPAWLQLCSPLAAVAVVGAALLAWRAGVHRYTSTGS